MSIGKKLLKLRIERKLTQQEVADYLNIARQTVSKWENDKTLPPLETLQVLCDLYQITLSDLMDYHSSKTTVKSTYLEIQKTLNHIQHQNRKRQYLSYILMLLCLISLSSSIYVNNEFNKYREYLMDKNQYVQPTFHYYEHVFENKDFFSDSLNNPSYLKIKQIDVEKREATIEGLFILKKYSNDTNCSFLVDDFNEVKAYPLIKENENSFKLSCTIPFRFHAKVYLRIENGNGQIQVIDLQENESYMELFSFIPNYHENTTYIYIPIDENGQLQLDTLIYEPTYDLVKEGIYVGEYLQEGTIELKIVDSEKSLILHNTVPMGKKHIFHLDKPLSINQSIYVDIQIIGNTKTSGYSANFGGVDSKGNPTMEIVIKQQNQPFQIHPFEIGR